MKLTMEQAHRVFGQLIMHQRLSNADAEACVNKFIAHPALTTSSTINAMLEEGDPYLLQLVSEMVTDRISK